MYAYHIVEFNEAKECISVSLIGMYTPVIFLMWWFYTTDQMNTSLIQTVLH